MTPIGVQLKYQWFGKNVDLNLLTESVKSFLKAKKFTVRQHNALELNHVIGTYCSADGEVRTVVVKISGTPKDFTVELTVAVEYQSILKLSSFFTFFGGGALMLKELRSVEYYQKLEEKFWAYVERQVSQLAGTTKSSSLS